MPWVLFSLITQHDTLKAAAVAALIASVLIAAPAVLAGRPRMLELGAVVAFVGFTIVAFVVDPATTHWVARYARAIAALLLALIAFSSLLFVPFTEQYARESVPEEFWSTPRFKRVNRQLTAMWGSVFLVMMVSHILAGAIDTRRGQHHLQLGDPDHPHHLGGQAHRTDQPSGVALVPTTGPGARRASDVGQRPEPRLVTRWW